MKNLIQLLFLLCLTMMGAAHGAEPDTQVVPEAAPQTIDKKAKIVVIRSDALASSANGANVWIDEIHVRNIMAGSTLEKDVNPGKVKIRIKPSGMQMVRISKTIEADTVAGETYYFFADMQIFSGFKWKVMSKDEAVPLIEKYALAEQQLRKELEGKKER